LQFNIKDEVYDEFYDNPYSLNMKKENNVSSGNKRVRIKNENISDEEFENDISIIHKK
jgi:hypothetical protein